jgi:lipopolysaccharide transport system ATP-binding protein
MQAITRLCTRAILISRGGVQHDGPAAETAAKYLLSSVRTSAQRLWPDALAAPGDGLVRLREIRVRNESGDTVDSIDVRRSVGIEMVYDVLEDGHVLVPSLQIHNGSGTCLFTTHDLDPAWRGRARSRGTVTSVAWIPGNLLAEGLLLVSPSIATSHPPKNHVYCRDAIAFNVVESFEGDSARGNWDGAMPGLVRPLLKWTTQTAAAATVHSGSNARPQ